LTYDLVFDSDGHVRESDADIIHFLPEPYRDKQQLFAFPFFPGLDGWHRTATKVAAGKGGVGENPDAKRWLEYLDEAHLAATVLFPTGGLTFGLISDPAWAVALARGYNDWLYERFLRHDPRRLKGIALIPVQDPPAAAAELHRVVEDLGMVGGILPAVGMQRAFGSRQFWPIYEAAQELDTVLAVHGAPSHNMGLERMERLIEVRALTHPFSQMIQITSMLFSGVFDLFPRLRVAYCEAGSGWVPFMAERLDMEYEGRREQAPDLKVPPSEHLKGGRIYFHTELHERALADAIKALGRDDVFFSASDYPHEPKDEYPEKIEDFLERDDLSERAKRNVLWSNPIRMYGLDEAEVRAAAAGKSAAAAGSR
jgi:predicted TIM-barrel fold metal-dependent hydrolase